MIPESIFLTGKWRAFTKNTNPDEAKRKFKKLFGYKPKVCQIHKGMLLVGPIKKSKWE